MTAKKRKRGASLLDKQARGGDIALDGFTFQDGVTLAKTPRWLMQSGMTSFIREALGDTEVSFFVPGVGLRREVLEAKNHLVAPRELWKEIDRFLEMDAGAPGTFEWFTLACTGLSSELQPLVNGLRRIRDPYDFYGVDAAVNEQSYRDFEAIVKRLKRSAADAKFLFTRVSLEPNWAHAAENASALFKEALVGPHPEFTTYSGSCGEQAAQAVRRLILEHRNKPLTCGRIEEAIGSSRPTGSSLVTRPLAIHTEVNGSAVPPGAIRFRWQKYFGDGSRSYPPSKEWQRIAHELRAFRDWSISQKLPRKIRLSGDRRLSVSLAVGSVLSAVAGFSAEVDFRGTVWSTTDYPASATPTYHLQVKPPTGIGTDLIVSVGILRDIAASVKAYAESTNLRQSPRLEIQGTGPVVSAAQANQIVNDIKTSITSAISTSCARSIHLFYAGPSPLALFLGHRMNATGLVQCYEWVDGNNYVPTITLTP